MCFNLYQVDYLQSIKWPYYYSQAQFNALHVSHIICQENDGAWRMVVDLTLWAHCHGSSKVTLTKIIAVCQKCSGP
jgi:hypothetical protein